MRIHRHRRSKPKPSLPQFKINEQIRCPKLRVIDEQGQPLGVLDTSEAIKIAEERGFDIVEVSPKADPPVAKMLDYGQFKYQQEKEMRKKKLAQKQVDTKGIRLSPRIGEHDLNVRLGQAKKFLGRGDKLKIEIVLRGREKAHVDVAKEVMLGFVDKIKGELDIKIEQPFARQGGRLTIVVASV